MVSRSLEPVARRYTIYPAQSADRSELIAFLKAAYADQFNASEYQDEQDIIARWEWANIQNPLKESFQSLSWICRENASNRIVGHFGIMPISLKCKETYFPAAWGRDLIVLPEFRKLGIGPLLVVSVLEAVREKAAIFLIAGVGDQVYPMYKKFGFTDMGHIPLFVRVNRPDLIISNKIGNGPFTPLLSMLGKFAVKLFYIPSRIRGYIRGRSQNVCIKQIPRFADPFNILWQSASSSYGLIARRRCASLNWRFVEQPYCDYKIFKAFRKDSDDPAGYIVVRDGDSRGLRTGVITDIFASAKEADVIESLVNFAILYFAKMDDIALVRCDILNEDVAKVLRKFGFINIPSRTRFMFTSSRDSLDAAFFKCRNNWFIDYADSDLDLAGQVNS